MKEINYVQVENDSSDAAAVGYYMSGQSEFSDGMEKRGLIQVVLVVGASLLVMVALGIILGVSFGVSKRNERKLDSLSEYLWIDSDVGMDDIFAIQVLLIHLNNQKSLQQNNLLILSSLSSVHGMTPNATIGKEIIANMLKTNTLSSISKDRSFKIEKGSNFGLKDNLQKFRFEDADWYSNVDQRQTEFLQKTGFALKNQLIDRSKEGEETFHLEPTFSHLNNQVTQLEFLPDNSLTILAIGPLTNIALWIRNNPTKLEMFKRKVRRIVSMGGNSLFNGNRDMEWNYHCDAKSVQVVMQIFSEKFFMIGLDVANEEAISSEQLTNLKQLLFNKKGKSNTASLLSDLLTINPVSCTYDPITASFLIRPELFTFEQVKVNIDLSSVVNSTTEFAGRVYKDSSSSGIQINVANSFNTTMYYNLLHSLFSSL
ncbi:predicted protein [Naegleria gruberi]|uniref:Predicted protein n=1 Tax=Naegleria gruberi TaxID=5762 RepID=D2VEH1_NAEGR|nr:uncharacterized protein NAEGRDRAFT_48896 [Naegleria gruberi]EFC44876.1 predicted protein [Naegleria gruberi]|eukprot:XP_002677620.1 predicted protein [Naegleria gruberi strain NEG-M]